jgi:hypothetical protein
MGVFRNVWRDLTDTEISVCASVTIFGKWSIYRYFKEMNFQVDLPVCLKD